MEKGKALLYESEEYTAEIYDNCTSRVYRTKKGKIKIEIDGTRWIGNTGGFHVYKYFFGVATAAELLGAIADYEADEASAQDVDDEIDRLTGTG